MDVILRDRYLNPTFMTEIRARGQASEVASLDQSVYHRYGGQPINGHGDCIIQDIHAVNFSITK